MTHLMDSCEYEADSDGLECGKTTPWPCIGKQISWLAGSGSRETSCSRTSFGSIATHFSSRYSLSFRAQNVSSNVERRHSSSSVPI